MPFDHRPHGADVLGPRGAANADNPGALGGDILVPVFIANAEPVAGNLLFPDIPFFWLDCSGPGPVGDYSGGLMPLNI